LTFIFQSLKLNLTKISTNMKNGWLVVF
jgi:hypothetical protein